MFETTIAHNARQNIGHYQFNPSDNTATIKGNADTIDAIKALAEALGWKVVVTKPKDK